MATILDNIREHQHLQQKQIAILLDPDKLGNTDRLLDTLNLINEVKMGPVLVGGSLIVEEHFTECLGTITNNTDLPVILFPGSPLQVNDQVDATLLLSLISGRNPELLIGQHVAAASRLKASGTEILPTGYMLVQSDQVTTATYISNTTPIPRNKPDIAAVTGLAGEMLGLQLLYLDGGSGASHPVPPPMIQAVREATTVPLIVGGGIRSAEEAEQAFAAGANMVVVGNAVEKEPGLIRELSDLVQPVQKGS